MGMHIVYGILVVSFAAHAIAFAILAVKRQKKYYYFLIGTFAFLTALYSLKFNWGSAIPAWFGPTIAPTLVLRMLAIGCTLGYLLTISKIKGSWLSRVMGRG